MRLIHLTLFACLLPAALPAAESLNAEDMDNNFVPLHASTPLYSSTTGCTEDTKGEDKKCLSDVQDTTQSATAKALRDAEHHVVNEALANPQHNNPEVMPLPTQLPPANPALPTPQNLMQQWNSRPPM